MNERHVPGAMPDYGAYGYDPSTTGSYQTVGTLFADDSATGTYAFIPQQPQQPAYDQTYQQPFEQTSNGQYGYAGHGYSYPYDGGQTSGYGTDFTGGGNGYGPYVQQAQAYDPAQAPADSSWNTGGYAAYDPYAAAPADSNGGYPAAGAGMYAGAYDTTGTYTGFPVADPAGPQAVQAPGQAAAQDWDSGAYPAYGYGYASGFGYDASGDTGVYEYVSPVGRDETGYGSAPAAGPDAQGEFDSGLGIDLDAAVLADAARDEEAVRHDYAEDAPGIEPPARSRRRKPAKRSALLTVAVPSVAVMGVAAVGAAAVAGVGMADSPKTRADGSGTAPTTQLDRTLTGVSRDADDFAARANRSQQRVDLKQRQEAAKKAAQEAAARKEALRPKFVLPVKQKGLSAYFGQAGVNWMARHTGIDFPVFPGTPVMAVTDGTVRTQWNASYGNMAIVTAPDGTETWYCHLSSTKIRSGKVKAGTVIAYSGNTGNTTGPHLHFEVRPHGGEPIDPLPWLLGHGLDPR